MCAEAGLDGQLQLCRPSPEPQSDAALQAGPKVLVCNHDHDSGRGELVPLGILRQNRQCSCHAWW